MSYIDSAPIEPTPATMDDVLNQIEWLRQQLEQQIRLAQDAATREAFERALEIQQQQAARIQESLDWLSEEMRNNLEILDSSQRQRLTEITNQVYEDINRAQKKMAETVNRQMADLRTDIEDAFEGVNTSIKRQQTEINTINHQMQVMAEGINQLASDIDERFKQDERRMNNIQASIDQIHQRFHNEDEQAREAVKTARALMDVVERRTMLDRFAPDYEANDIRQRVKNLENSENNGAALKAEATEAITQIWQTERHAIQEKVKHDALVEVAMTQVERVLSVVNDNREIKKAVENGDPISIENDFWSEGEYGRLEKELKGLMKELEDRYNQNLTRQRIDAIVKRSAQIEGRILQICAESVAKAVLSEARVETVEDIINVMQGKGWMLKGLKEGAPQNNYMGGEEDNDWRKGVFAVLENNLGEIITVIVDPVSDTQNKLIIHQETSGRTDQEINSQMEAIKQQLCEGGYTIGETTSGITHIPEMGSANRLGQAHATDKVRQKVDKI